MTAATANKVARILVIEDDEPTRELLTDHLKADQFDTMSAGSAEEARTAMSTFDADLLLLDLTLPDDALGLLKEIRENEDDAVSGVGVIVISGRATERERIRALGDGADDHCQKPFSYGELLARIGAVLRRRKSSGEVTTVGEIEINNRTGDVKVAGRQVRLSQKELAILKMLAKEPDRVFSHEEMLREIWGYRSMGHTRTLEAHCARLSRKLDPDKGSYIVNCWGVGRRLRWS